ncbi:MAG: hypothetical protein ABUS56_08350 [Acidobacteriota bacterium]
MRAYVELELPAERRADVLPLLGLGLRGTTGDPGRVPVDASESPDPAATTEATAPASTPHAEEEWLDEEWFPALLTSLGRDAAARRPVWLDSTSGVAPIGAPSESDAPTPEPLLAPMTARAVLAELLKTSKDGPADVIEAIETLARAEPLQHVPRRSVRSIARGAQVLVDAGDGMVPFRRDQTELVRETRRLAGRAAVEALRFAGSPLRGAGRGPRRSWGTWRPPPNGTPIIVISDLGTTATDTGSAALPSEWRMFAARARAAECPVVALVPCPSARVPPSLRVCIAVVEWDRGTGIRHARLAEEAVRR